MRRRLALLLALASGCAHAELADATAPEVPCEAEGIEILGTRGTGMMNNGGPQSWTAQCGEQVHFCSRLHRETICTTVPEGFDPNATSIPPDEKKKK